MIKEPGNVEDKVEYLALPFLLYTTNMSDYYWPPGERLAINDPGVIAKQEDGDEITSCEPSCFMGGWR